MKNSSHYDLIIFYIFAVIGTCLSVVVTLIDFSFDIDTTHIKYFGIFLCTCFAAYSTLHNRKHAITVLCALLFTLIADFFLLVRDDNYEVGVCSFIIVQSFYFCRIYTEKKKSITISLLIRICTIVVGIIILYALDLLEFLTAVSVIYACMLVGNVIESYSEINSGIGHILFAVGLTLFACCDFCVMLYNLNSFIAISIPQRTLDVIVNIAWLFYLPSQIIISLSSSTAVSSF